MAWGIFLTLRLALLSNSDIAEAIYVGWSHGVPFT